MENIVFQTKLPFTGSFAAWCDQRKALHKTFYIKKRRQLISQGAINLLFFVLFIYIVTLFFVFHKSPPNNQTLFLFVIGIFLELLLGFNALRLFLKAARTFGHRKRNF
jgi:hypothetical protein